MEGAVSRRKVILVSPRLRSWRALYKQDETLPIPRFLGAIRGMRILLGNGGSWGRYLE